MANWKNLLKTLDRKVLGIINITMDSFSGDGAYKNSEKLSKLLEKAKSERIEILDIGCMSTKPEYKKIDTSEEIKRLNFFIQNNMEKFYLSIDTMNSEVANHALNNKFEIINDVSGFRDSHMIDIALEQKSKIILVHNHPDSFDIHQKMKYKNLLDEVKAHLHKKITELLKLGFNEGQIAVDPGLGFGKKIEDSAELLKKIEQFQFGFPIVVGYSNKKFTQLLNMSSKDLFQHSLNSGVDLVRLHI